MSPEVEARLTALAADARQRLRWRVLRAFGVLPTERRAGKLDDRAVVECALHMILDLSGPPPAGAENPAFDQARFEELKHHGKVDNV